MYKLCFLRGTGAIIHNQIMSGTRRVELDRVRVNIGEFPVLQLSLSRRNKKITNGKDGTLLALYFFLATILFGAKQICVEIKLCLNQELKMGNGR